MNKEIENIKEQLEEVIKKNLPEKKELFYDCGDSNERGFNQALSQINTSLIADEVLKVVVEIASKIDSEKIAKSQRDMDGGKYTDDYIYGYYQGMNKVKQLLSEHLSPNKENENNG